MADEPSTEAFNDLRRTMLLAPYTLAASLLLFGMSFHWGCLQFHYWAAAIICGSACLFVYRFYWRSGHRRIRIAAILAPLVPFMAAWPRADGNFLDVQYAGLFGVAYSGGLLIFRRKILKSTKLPA